MKMKTDRKWHLSLSFSLSIIHVFPFFPLFQLPLLLFFIHLYINQIRWEKRIQAYEVYENNNNNQNSKLSVATVHDWCDYHHDWEEEKKDNGLLRKLLWLHMLHYFIITLTINCHFFIFFLFIFSVRYYFFNFVRCFV